MRASSLLRQGSGERIFARETSWRPSAEYLNLECAFPVQQGVSLENGNLRSLSVVIVPGFNHLKRPPVGFGARSDRSVCHPFVIRGVCALRVRTAGNFFDRFLAGDIGRSVSPPAVLPRVRRE